MDFGFSDEQELLRREARKLLDEACPVSEVRALQQTASGHSPELWKQLGELGWLGLIGLPSFLNSFLPRMKANQGNE